MSANLIGRIGGQPWAIHASALEVILAIAAREDVNPASLEAWKSHARTAPQALADRPADPLPGSRTASLRNGVAIIPVSGPIFRHASLFTEISGATALGNFSADLALARDDSRVKAILLEIDSPGGETTGMMQASAAVRAAAAAKPVLAYVEGMACSAAYMLAAAASSVVLDSMATVGCLGVVGVMTDRRAADAKAGIVRHEIVSSQTPGKRPDPATETGRAQMQTMIDRLASEYLADVAGHRGMSVDALLAATDGGGLVVGADAVAAGLADAVGGFEDTLARLAVGIMPRATNQPQGPRHQSETPMSTPTASAVLADPVHTPDAAPTPAPVAAAPVATPTPPVAAPAADPVAAERARCAAIQTEAGGGWQALAALAIESGWSMDQFRAARTASQSAVDSARQTAAASSFAASMPEPVQGNAPDAATDPEAAAKAKWNADPKLRAEFGDSQDRYLAFTRAQASGRVKLISKR